MLELELRSEFKDRRLRGTAIDFENKKGTGALQKSAREFFDITYPTQDVLQLLEASQPQNGLPICLSGVRGQGKSHLMAMLYHAICEPKEADQWLQGWGEKLGIQEYVSKLSFRSGFHIIAENLNYQRYKYLWDLIFERHPRGEYYKGKWEGMGESKTNVPPYDLFQEMFQEQPTALVLDEFQTWYEGLTNTKQFPWKNWAFSFIQNLSEIAKNEPENLLLVVSVREEKSDAYEQIHRVNPTVIDFTGKNKKRDRMRLLLHRLFENRSQIPTENIRTLIGPHLRESCRLENVPESEHEALAQDFMEAWPFSPRLFQLLEDQILIATSAQETRDMIRILANLYRGNGHEQPVITAADFRIDSDDNSITSLLDSVSNPEHSKLREKALRNLESVQQALKDHPQSVPHLPELLSALWLRSLSRHGQKYGGFVSCQSPVRAASKQRQRNRSFHHLYPRFDERQPSIAATAPEPGPIQTGAGGHLR